MLIPCAAPQPNDVVLARPIWWSQSDRRKQTPKYRNLKHPSQCRKRIAIYIRLVGNAVKKGRSIRACLWCPAMIYTGGGAREAQGYTGLGCPPSVADFRLMSLDADSHVLYCVCASPNSTRRSTSPSTILNSLWSCSLLLAL